MTGATVAIAPIPLARSRRRMLVVPGIMFVTGALAAAAGAVRGDVPGIGMVVAGLVLAAFSVALWLVLVSVRLDVEVAMLRLRWLGGERRYTLVRGPVTRVPLRGAEAARLRPRFGALGWALGRARLRGSETIELVRLAATDTMILVPTDRGRVGVAPASEQQFLNALAAAARIQQRLDEVAERARAFVAIPRPAPVEPPPVETPEPHPPGARVLTGIERAILEQRLAAQRAAAILAAQGERQAAAEAARMAALSGAEQVVAAVPTAPSRPRPDRRSVRLPALNIPRPWLEVQPGRFRDFAILALPAVAALGIWVVAMLQQRLEVLPLQELRPVAAALLATGPVAALAAVAARVWFPRLLGLVTVTSLTALVLVARALLG
jgi:hypothetical protein